jgi:hypothetical protein
MQRIAQRIFLIDPSDQYSNQLAGGVYQSNRVLPKEWWFGVFYFGLRWKKKIATSTRSMVDS